MGLVENLTTEVEETLTNWGIDLSELFDKIGGTWNETMELFKESEDYQDEFFSCKFVYWNSTEQIADYREQFTYFSLVLAVVLVIVAAFLNVRKSIALDFLGGRPSIPVPINLIEDQRDRLIVIFGFCLFTMNIIDLLFNNLPFHWNYHSSLKGLVLIIISILIGLICYPFFAAVTARSPILYLLVSFYTWFYTIAYIFQNLPCKNYDKYQITIWFFGQLPILGVKIFLCFLFPYRGLRLWYHRRDKTGNFLEDNREMYQVQHVKRLLKSNKATGAEENKKIIKLLQNKFYASIPGFRYSTGILVSVSLSILIIYMLAYSVFTWIYNITEHLLNPIEMAINRRNPTFLLRSSMRNTFQTYLDLFKALTGKKNLLDLVHEVYYFFRAMKIGAYIGLIVGFLLTSTSLILSLKSYRKRLLKLYKGDKAFIKAVTGAPRSILVSSTKFLGYQVGYAAWGFILQFAVLFIAVETLALILILIFRYGLTFILIWALEKLAPWLLYLVVVVSVQQLLAHFVFLLTNSTGQRVIAINNRRAFFNFYYFMIFINVPLGFLSCIQRILLAVVFGLWVLPRLDISTLSRQFEKFDKGFAAYACFLRVQNAQTNPVVLVLANLLQESVTKHLPNGSRPNTAKVSAKIESVKVVEKSLKWKRARNRWQLFLTLEANPGLRLNRNTNNCWKEEEKEDVKTECEDETSI